MQKKSPQVHQGIGTIILAYVAFIALGMPDSILGVAWPSIREGFGINLDAMGALLLASVTGYLTSSFTSGVLLARFGVGCILSASCAVSGLGLLAYTIVPGWGWMVLLGAVAGIGAGAIDAGLNTYAASHFHDGLMQWLHASYGVGATLGPVIMTLALTTNNSWRLGYRVVGIFQLALALCFAITMPLWNRNPNASETHKPTQRIDYSVPVLQTLRQPGAWFGILLFFFYTGAEVALGAWAFTLLTESRGIVPSEAGFWTGSYWGTFTAGRILAGLYARRVGVDTLVTGSFAAAFVGSILLWWNPSPNANLVAVIFIGLAIAPIFPGLVSGTSSRVAARFVTNTIGMQMSAGALGAAAIPGLVGMLARRSSLEAIPLCLLTLFLGLFILYRISMTSIKI